MAEDESEVVNSIYEGAMLHRAEGVYLVSVPESPVSVRMRFSPQYPAVLPSIVAVDGFSGSPKALGLLETVLRAVFVPDEVVVFSFLDEVATLLQDQSSDLALLLAEVEARSTNNLSTEPEPPGSAQIQDWATSDEVKDRKSVFIGRAIRVSSLEDATEKVADLMQDKRIARATHNIQAWRIGHRNSSRDDFDDDGESAAGSRLLRLLQVANAENVIVVVSRWYGGILLGPDRFKHINTCARDALVRGNFIPVGH